MPADMAELCDDVGILSRTVASLADAMARQERPSAKCAGPAVRKRRWPAASSHSWNAPVAIALAT